MTSTAISVIGMDIYAVGGTIVSQCRLQCCQMAITIYRRLMKLFLLIWQHHRLTIVSTSVSILHGQMPLIPPLGHGTTNPKLDAFLLQCTLCSSGVWIIAHRGEPLPDDPQDAPSPVLPLLFTLSVMMCPPSPQPRGKRWLGNLCEPLHSCGSSNSSPRATKTMTAIIAAKNMAGK